MPEINTRQAAIDAEHAHIECVRQKAKERATQKEEVPTFEKWFNGRFWEEWVIGRKNKPSEVDAKKIIFKCHLKEAFGAMRLNEIDDSEVARFRARLVRESFSEKRINNILAVL